MRRLGTVLSSVPAFALASLLLVGFYLLAYPTMSVIIRDHTPAGAAYDTELYYSPAAAISKAQLYGAADRTAITRMHWTYDLAFPIAYGLCLGSAWAVGLRLIAGGNRTPRYAPIALPLAAMAFDILENASVTLLLGLAPLGENRAIDKALVALASVGASASTLIKWILVAVSVAGALALPLAGLVIRSRRARRSVHDSRD